MPTPQVGIEEATGIPPLPSTDIISRVAILAVANDGTLDTKPLDTLAGISDEYDKGVLVRHSKHIFARTKKAFLAQRCEATNVGSYGTLDDSAFTGTALPVVVSATVPTDEAELYIKIVEGGTFGTTGIKYRRSDSYGREGDSSMPLRALGTATRIEFDAVNAAIEFDPPLAAVLTYVNELVDDAIDHFAEGATIHGAADAGPYTISGTAASQSAAITRLVEAIAAAKLHVVKISSSIHGAADNTVLAALNAITTPTTGQTLITTAIAFETAFFGDGLAVNSGHTMRTASSIHGSVDATNVIAAATPSRGTAVAGDIVRVNTVAPSPTSGEVATAFTTLADSDYTPALVLLPGRTPANYRATISQGLDNMKDQGKPCLCYVQARKRTDGDATLADYRDNVEAEWIAEGLDNRIKVVFGDYRWDFTDGANVRRRLIGSATHLMVREINTEYFRTIWDVSRGQIEDAYPLNESGVFDGWSEPQGRETQLQAFYRVPNAELGRPLVASVDYSLADLDQDRTTTGRERRVTDELARIVGRWAWNQVGALSAVTRIPNTTTGTLKASVRASYERSLAAIIQQRMGGTAPNCAISDTDLPDLVSINPTVTLVGANVYLAVTVNYTIIGANERVDTVLSVRAGQG